MSRSRGLPRGLTPLRHRGFRLLTAGQLSSSVGDACYAVALPWYVLAEHGGALLLGTVLAAYGIPRTALLVVGGQASDRWRPWTVMMASDAVRAVAVAGLAAAAMLGPARAALLVPVAAALGAGEGMFIPAAFAIAPALLPDRDLQAGNALTSAGTQIATLVGPVAGGAAVALLGPAPAFGVDAASFGLSVLTLAGVRRAQRSLPATGRGAPVVAAVTGTAMASVAAATDTHPAAAGDSRAASPAGTAADGAESPASGQPSLRRMLRSEPVLRIGLLLTLASNLGFGGMSEVALPALARGPLHAGAGGYGGLIAAFAVGALLGTVTAAQLRRLRRPAVASSVGCLGQAAAMAAVPYLGGPVAAGAALIAFGALNGFGNVVMITAFQRWAPPGLLGRLAGLLTLASLGIFPVSVLLGAIVVRDLGPAPFFVFAAVALALAVLAGLTSRAWRNFGATDPPAGPAALPEPEPAAAARS
jgi:predicted MFS family arabinose efflux permease